METIYKQFGIYRITNKINGKSYIGKTGMNFGDRWDSHRSLLNSNKHFNKHLQRAWNKFGAGAFEFEIVEAVDDAKMLNDLERKYIAQYRAMGICYNLHDGGDGGYNLGKHLSDSTKKKIGEKNRNNMIGRKASPTTRTKMSISHKNRYASWTEEDRRAWGKLTSATASGYKWSEEAKQNFSMKQRQNPNGASFTPDDIRSIRAKRANGEKLSQIAKEYNTSESYISSIVHRRRWAYMD